MSDTTTTVLVAYRGGTAKDTPINVLSIAVCPPFGRLHLSPPNLVSCRRSRFHFSQVKLSPPGHVSLGHLHHGQSFWISSISPFQIFFLLGGRRVAHRPQKVPKQSDSDRLKAGNGPTEARRPPAAFDAHKKRRRYLSPLPSLDPPSLLSLCGRGK